MRRAELPSSTPAGHDDVLGLSRAVLPEELKKWALSALRRGS